MFLIGHLYVAPCEVWGELFGCVGSGEVSLCSFL